MRLRPRITRRRNQNPLRSDSPRTPNCHHPVRSQSHPVHQRKRLGCKIHPELPRVSVEVWNSGMLDCTFPRIGTLDRIRAGETPALRIAGVPPAPLNQGNPTKKTPPKSCRYQRPWQTRRINRPEVFRTCFWYIQKKRSDDLFPSIGK